VSPFEPEEHELSVVVASMDLDITERKVERSLEANDLPAREFGGVVNVEVSPRSTLQLGIKVVEHLGNLLKKGGSSF